MASDGLLLVAVEESPPKPQSYFSPSTDHFQILVTPNSIEVSILTDNGINVASDQDFDPNLSSDDARIESGASLPKVSPMRIRRGLYYPIRLGIYVRGR